ATPCAATACCMKPPSPPLRALNSQRIPVIIGAMTAQSPNCNFHGSTVLALGERKCANCSRVRHMPYYYPQMPSTSNLPVRTTGHRSGLLVVVAAVTVLVIGGLITAVAFGEESERGDSAHVPAPEATTFKTPEPVKVKPPA